MEKWRASGFIYRRFLKHSSIFNHPPIPNFKRSGIDFTIILIPIDEYKRIVISIKWMVSLNIACFNWVKISIYYSSC